MGLGRGRRALRADGHDVTALTLPGLESADTDRSRSRSRTTSTRSSTPSTRRTAPVVLAVHSATGLHRIRRQRPRPREDRGHGLRRHRTRQGRPGPRLRGRREADGLGGDRGGGEPRRAQRGAEGDVPAARRAGARQPPPRGHRADERRAPRHPEHPDLHRIHGRAVPDVRARAPRVGVPCRHPRAARRDLGRPADQPLADVVASEGAGADHRRRREERTAG